MNRTHKARAVTAEWNETRSDLFVPFETVEECLLAFLHYQAAIARWDPPHKVAEYLEYHNEFSRRIPDELLLVIFDEEGED